MASRGVSGGHLEEDGHHQVPDAARDRVGWPLARAVSAGLFGELLYPVHPQALVGDKSFLDLRDVAQAMVSPCKAPARNMRRDGWDSVAICLSVPCGAISGYAGQVKAGLQLRQVAVSA